MSATRVLFTGSREWSDWDAVRKVLRALPAGTVIIHGDGRGLDKMADWLARNECGFAVLPYPANWNLHGKAAGPRRNAEMLQAAPTHGVAFLKPELPCRGTRHMLGLLRKAGVPVRVVGDADEISDW